MKTSKSKNQKYTEVSSPANEIEAPKLPLSDRLLPPVIRQIVTNAPDTRKVAAFIACLSPLCALATRVRIMYPYDSRLSALLLQVIIEGEQSSGKSFAADIVSTIMSPTIKEHDRAQRLLEQEYREKKKQRKANEAIGAEPITSIREIPANVSKTVLTKRADYYQRNFGDVLTFWMFAEELAQIVDAGKQGYSNLRTIMRTAYDLGSEFGVDFASDNSYSAIVDINICSMFCATPSAVDDYVDRKALEGGNVTRMMICRLPDGLGSEAAIFTPYSDKQQREINDTLRLIMSDTYNEDKTLRPTQFIDTTWLDSDVRKWTREKGDEALRTGSIALDVFRKRASVSAYRAAVLCYYLYEKEIDRSLAISRSRVIYRFLANYILEGLLERWGSRFIECVLRRDSVKLPRKKYGLYYELPDNFSLETMEAAADSMHIKNTKIILRNWKKKGWVIMIDENNFKKTNIKDAN